MACPESFKTACPDDLDQLANRPHSAAPNREQWIADGMEIFLREFNRVDDCFLKKDDVPLSCDGGGGCSCDFTKILAMLKQQLEQQMAQKGPCGEDRQGQVQVGQNFGGLVLPSCCNGQMQSLSAAVQVQGQGQCQGLAGLRPQMLPSDGGRMMTQNQYQGRHCNMGGGGTQTVTAGYNANAGGCYATTPTGGYNATTPMEGYPPTAPTGGYNASAAHTGSYNASTAAPTGSYNAPTAAPTGGYNAPTAPTPTSGNNATVTKDAPGRCVVVRDDWGGCGNCESTPKCAPAVGVAPIAIAHIGPAVSTLYFPGATATTDPQNTGGQPALSQNASGQPISQNAGGGPFTVQNCVEDPCFGGNRFTTAPNNGSTQKIETVLPPPSQQQPTSACCPCPAPPSYSTAGSQPQVGTTPNYTNPGQ